jgi:hypothetical protein
METRDQSQQWSPNAEQYPQMTTERKRKRKRCDLLALLL